MGGDTPLDIQGHFEDICGVGYSEGGDYEPLTNLNINENRHTLVNACEESGDDTNIAYQVLGFHILRTGARLPIELAERIMQACKQDEWARQGHPERIKHIVNMIQAIEYYTGRPVELTSETLFQTIGAN
jgi:hypothetical protein